MILQELINSNKIKKIPTIVINDPVEYLKITGDYFYNGFYLSRGHENISWKLLPSIFRESVINQISSHIKHQYESFLTTEFSDKFNFYQQEPNVQNDDANCLITMQHYGLPTRLLDWTNDIQTSLFFAVNYTERNKNKRKEYAIWFLNPDEYRQIYGTPGGTYFRQTANLIKERCEISFLKSLDRKPAELQYPLFFSPKYLFPRIEAQNSIFSVHGWNKIAFEDLDNANKFLKCIIIEDINDKFYNYVNNILNLTYRKFFPDVFGFVEDMKRGNTN